MPKKQFCYDYPRPMVTVDVAILTREERPRVLLIRRGGEPFAGMWALPGGYVDMDEDLPDAARRELIEETGVEAGELEQVGAFGAPGRDPRGRTISIAYLARVDAETVSPKGGDDAREAAWHPLHHLPELAFDHKEILAAVKRRLRQA